MRWPSQDRESDHRAAPERAGRLLGAALSVIGHLLILLALLSVRPPSTKALVSPPVTVELIDERQPVPDATPAAATEPSHAVPPAQPSAVRPTPAPTTVDPVPAGKAPEDEAGSGSELSDAQLAGAASADAGAPGGACDMARRVQSALRKDPLVRAAVAASAGRATMVWNGDWVRSHGEDGKGLAAVREAIMWEVAFAPPACRAQAVHGLILLSLNTAPGAVHLAIGSGEWRWSDLLTARANLTDDAPERR